MENCYIVSEIKLKISTAEDFNAKAAEPAYVKATQQVSYIKIILNNSFFDFVNTSHCAACRESLQIENPEVSYLKTCLYLLQYFDLI